MVGRMVVTVIYRVNHPGSKREGKKYGRKKGEGGGLGFELKGGKKRVGTRACLENKKEEFGHFHLNL